MMTKVDFRLFLVKRVKALRKNSGLSQEALVEKIGYSWRSISNIERGKSIPELLYLVKMACFFHVSLDSFFPPVMSSFSKTSEYRQNIESQFISLLRQYDDRILGYIERIFREQMGTLEKCGFIHKTKLENFGEIINIRDNE